MYDKFEALDTVVIAVAQEDDNMADHGKMLKSLEATPRFHVVADLGRKKTKSYDRTTAYLINKQGIVRQIFPMLIHARPTWNAILGEVAKLP